jgi:hypothetical protein
VLEDRIDSRLQADADLSVDEPPQGLADRWKMNRREMEAAVFDNIADQIEAGLLKVRGVKKADVVDRLRGRADGTREGTDRMKRRPLRSLD